MNLLVPRARLLRLTLGLLDGVFLAAAVFLAHLIRFAPFDRGAKWEETLSHPGLLALSLLALWALAVAAELYEPLLIRRRGEMALRQVVVAVAWSVALAVLTFLVPRWAFGRGLLGLTAGLWLVLAVSCRSWAAFRVRRRTPNIALVVGPSESVAETCRRLRDHPLAPWLPESGAELAPGEVVNRSRSINPAAVVLAAPGDVEGEWAASLAELHFSGVPVVVASELWAWLDGRLPVGELSPAFFLHQSGFSAVHWHLFNRLTRVLDVVLGGSLLLLATPLFLASALAVWVVDGRPVVFRQVRLGQFGRPFILFKMRTMRRDAEREGPAFAGPADPRVTALGRLLRRLRLDELPQLLNVLRGEMSLVGPRPERPEFVAELAAKIPYYTFRLAVPPGLTGWAQVHVPYAATVDEHRRKLEFDLYFIRERSVGLYLLVLLRTASAALVGVRH